MCSPFGTPLEISSTVLSPSLRSAVAETQSPESRAEQSRITKLSIHVRNSLLCQSTLVYYCSEACGMAEDRKRDKQQKKTR